MRSLFKGVATAMITPFDENGVDFIELKRLIDRQIEADIDALVIMGTTGEPSTMTEDEKRETIRFAAKYANGRIKIIAGTGANDTKKAVEASIFAESVGCDGVLCVTPYYNKCTKNGIIKYYETIASAISIPVIAYNVPSRTGVNITPDVAEKLAEIPNLYGIKEASGNISQITQTAFAIEYKIALYSGDDELIIPFLSLGSSGTISVLSNVIPKETKKIHEMYFNGDIDGAYKLFKKVYPLAHSLFLEVNPIPCKAALYEMGFNTKLIREPLTEMEDGNRAKLISCMKELGIL